MTEKPIYYLAPEGAFYSTVSYKGVRGWCQLMLSALEFKQSGIAGIPSDSRVKVVSVLPWNQHVQCIDCEHETTVYRCESTRDGLVCPKCAVVGSMAPLLPANRELHIDIFDRGPHEWYWSASGSYPWGPFPTREDAVFDAEANGFTGVR